MVFDGRLFIPPIGTLNRRITGELGDALDLGHGYLIHGSSEETSIAQATHAWLHSRGRRGSHVGLRERPGWYCCHDPLSAALVAAGFECHSERSEESQGFATSKASRSRGIQRTSGDVPAPLSREVLPAWVEGFNERDLLAPRPTLELLLSFDCGMDARRCFDVNEAVHIVPPCEASVLLRPVLAETSSCVIRYTHVQTPRTTREDVYEVRHWHALKDVERTG